MYSYSVTEPPFVIAEISGNHNGSLERAIEIVKASAAAGVNAIKLQTYTPDTITLNVDSPSFRISSSHSLWGERLLYDLYKEAHMPWDWQPIIFEICRELNVIPFSTPFDESAVEFLEKINCPMYKIASLEIVDLPLIKLAASTGKPIIISTGAASLQEIDSAVSAARNSGAKDITLLVCSSSYPAKPNEINLKRIPFLKDRFKIKVGYSDHTVGTQVAVAAVALGATVIEKHVTLSKIEGGVDSAFSAEPHEMKLLVESVRIAHESIGSQDIWVTESESESLRLRPSLYFSENVKEGDLVTEQNVRSVRPAGGLPPEAIDRLIGMKIKKDAKIGDPTDLSYFE